MSLSNVRLQRANDIALAADRVMDRARDNFLSGKDYDPGDFLPSLYIVEASRIAVRVTWAKSTMRSASRRSSSAHARSRISSQA